MTIESFPQMAWASALFLMLALGLGLSLGTAEAAKAAEAGKPSSPASAATPACERSLEVTVYNDDLVLVKDRRWLDLAQGTSEVRLPDVAATIRPTTVQVRSLTTAGQIEVLEQSYLYDIINTDKLLEKYIEKEISVITKDDELHRGFLLQVAGDQLILGTEPTGGEVTVLNRSEVKVLRFPSLPTGLITRPTLAWLLLNQSDVTKQQIELSYLASGMSWRADYVATLSANDEGLDLVGWVTVDNRSGISFPNATLKLVAGDVNQVVDEFAQAYVAEAEPKLLAGAPVSQEQLFEYYLYSVNRPVTLRENETKQIEFMTATGIPVSTDYVYDGTRGMVFGGSRYDAAYGTVGNKKVQVIVHFKNSEENGLGMALPEGVIRISKADSAGSLQFIGEDRIDHTPKDEEVRLVMGDAFDLVGERVQTSFRLPTKNSAEESFRITLRNHKDHEVVTRVVEHLYRWIEWSILKSSHEYEKKDKSTIEFQIPVPANGSVDITYTVGYRW